jgi:hypothetical protein
MKTVSHSVAILPSSECTEVHHFICVSAVAAACLKNILIKVKNSDTLQTHKACTAVSGNFQ